MLHIQVLTCYTKQKQKEFTSLKIEKSTMFTTSVYFLFCLFYIAYQRKLKT